MEDFARSRRERLKKIQALSQGKIEEAEFEGKIDQPTTTGKKRSAEEQDLDLKDKNSTSYSGNSATVEKKADEIARDAKLQSREQRDQEIDIAQLAPKKIDWDLKRDIEKQVEILDKQTHRKINELVRRRLLEESKTGKGISADLANTVSLLDSSNI